MSIGVGDMDAGGARRLNLVRHLEFFVTIADERHFGRAAARLGIAQPPLSQGVRRLEAALGVTLFDRGRGGAALTPAGRDLLPHAQSVLAATVSLRTAADRHSRGGRRVQLGVTPELGPGPAADAASVAGRRGDVRVEVFTDASVRLLDQVAGGLIDLALVAHPVPLEGLVGGPVIGVPTEVLVPAGHRAAADGQPVALRALSDLEFATGARGAGPAAFDLLVETLEIRGCTSSTAPVADAAAALALVAGGHAFALTADPDLSAEAVARRAVAGPPVPLRLRLVRRPAPADRDRSAAEAVDAVFDAVGDVVRRRGEPAS